MQPVHFHLNEAIVILGLKYVLDALIGAWEAPLDTDSRWYKFLFRFCNLLAANIKRSSVTK